MGDPLFMLRNYYLIGAYNAAINEASDIEGLPAPVQVEKDAYVYRSYIELGSHDVRRRVWGSRGPRDCGGRQEALALCRRRRRRRRERNGARARVPPAPPPRPPINQLPSRPDLQTNKQTHINTHKRTKRKQLVISEIADTAPIGLRAVKLLAQVRGGALPAADALAALAEWREQDVAGAARDPHVLLVSGALHAAEGNHVEALKACNSGPQTLEM